MGNGTTTVLKLIFYAFSYGDQSQIEIRQDKFNSTFFDSDNAPSEKTV